MHVWKCRKNDGSSHNSKRNKNETVSFCLETSPQTIIITMSLINFVPFMLDDFGSYKPLKLFDRDNLPSLSSDYEEDDKEIRFSVDVPGVKASDLDVTVKDGQLHVSGVRKTKSVDGKTVKRARYAKTFTLDEDATDVTQMKANLSDGVLVVSVPKKAKKSPVKIAITTEPHQQNIEVSKKHEKQNETVVEKKD